METNRIEIENLNAAGSDLFNDRESFLDEVKGEELEMTQGGTSTTICISVTIAVTVATYRATKKALDL